MGTATLAAPLTSRVRALDRHRLDALAGGLIGMEMQLEVTLAPLEGERALLVRGLMLALALALVLRRRTPVLSFLTALGVFIAVQSLDRVVTDHLYVPLFAVLFLNYSVAANVDGRRFWLAPPLAYGAGLFAALVDDYDDTVADGLLWLGLVFVAGPMVAGRLIRNRTHLQRALRDKAARIEREEGERAEAAVLEERSRIARELHDIVADAVTGMTIQASAAARLAERDPVSARGAFAAVEDDGREALGELRRLLGVLRRGDEEPALSPQPSMRHIDALAHRIAADGLPVELWVEGEPVELPSGVDVTGYRVVQEALGGARDQRAAGRAEVRVRYAPLGVEVEVRDDGAVRGDGSAPMPGLRERVALYGGDLQAHRVDEGGHVVRAWLPLVTSA